MQTLNRQLTQQIGGSSSPTILGLLPVETTDQEQILQKVTAHLDGNFNRLIQALYLHPALVSYAVAVAVGKGNTEANFYDALANVLGIELGQTQRPRFSEQFEISCRQLGLVVLDGDADAHTDRYIWPVILQAGILPYWVPHLAHAIKAYLRQSPCPDLDDEEQVSRFSRWIFGRVPLAQNRLRRLLNTEVGPLICRAILRAVNAENFDLLPPHYREPMREAFGEGPKEHIRSPYLRYEYEDGSFQVVLPKQSSRLASYNTCWIVGSNTYNALVERTLKVSELLVEKLQICLAHLRNQFTDQVFTMKLVPDTTDPFFIFRADGRRFLLAMRPVIELPLGDYHLVVPAEHNTSEEESFTTKGQFKAAKIEIFPGRDDLQIFVGQQAFILRPRLGSDFMVHDKEGNKLETVDGAVLYYGDKLEVQAFTPAISGTHSQAMEFKIECPGNATAKMRTCRRDKADDEGAYHFYNVSKDLVDPFLGQLAPGIHEVKITAEGHARSFTRHLLYWNGFRRTTKSFGFVCEKPPVNFDEANSVGVRLRERGLEICEDHFGPEVVIGVKQPNRTFTLAKPGIWLRLLDQEKLESRPLTTGKSIEVNPAVRELLIVESGDTLPWEITCQGNKIAVLKPGQAKQTLNLGALLSQFGESGALKAENPSGQSVHLLSFARANLARGLKVDSSTHSPLYKEAQTFFGGHRNLAVEESAVPSIYRACFVIGRVQIERLAVDVSNFSTGGRQLGYQEITVEEGDFGVAGLPNEAAKLRIAATDGDWAVSLEADPKLLQPGLYFIDFRVKKPGQTRWQPLRVADKHGVSESRLVLQTGPTCAPGTSALERLLNQSCQKPNLDLLSNDPTASINISEDELAPTLARLQEALLFKYATPVWTGIEWLKTALVLLCQNGYSAWNDRATRVFGEAAVAGLSRKGESSLSVHSTLIFGSQERIMAQDGTTFSEAEPSDTLIGRTFREVGKLAKAKSLKEHVMRDAAKSSALDFGFVGRFSNCFEVNAEKAEEFRNFQYQDFFEHLTEKSRVLEHKQAEIDALTLLSSEHLLTAVRALNRRLRLLALASNQDKPKAAGLGKPVEEGHSLRRMVAEIRTIHATLDRIAPEVKELAGIPPLGRFFDPHSGIKEIPEEEQTTFGLIVPAETIFAQMLSDILMTMAGLGRLNACGLLRREDFFKRLIALLSPEGDALERRTGRLSLCLSLAPELFAFHMLFWEATLKPLAKQ
jgi:hypothetical protein